MIRPAADGYWYTPYGGEREWRDAPRCSCGGNIASAVVKPINEAGTNEVIARMLCQSCGDIKLEFLKPGDEAIAFGRVLAERYGW